MNWGALDYLVVDLPPGTGDEALSIAQLAPNVQGAVIVTTPQDVAVLDAVKAVKFIEKLELPGHRHHREHERDDLPPLRGYHRPVRQGRREEGCTRIWGFPYLGAIPLDPAMVKAGDEGRPYVLRHADTPTWKAVDAVMENLVKRVES